MATKKTTTKAKTKKSAKTTRASKATSKTATKKVVNVKPVSLDLLSKLNISNVLLSLLGAVAAYIFMNSTYYSITVSYLAENALAGNMQQSAYRLFSDVSLKFLLIVTLLIAVIKPLLDITKYKDSYQKNVKEGYVPARFLDQAFQYGMFVTLAAVLAGYQDLATIKLFAIVGVTVSLFAWLAERNAKDTKQALLFNAFSGFAALIVTFFLLASMVLTYTYGQVWASWHILLATLLVAIFMLLNVLNQRMRLMGNKKLKDYKTVERNYLLIGMAARVDLAVILILGFLK